MGDTLHELIRSARLEAIRDRLADWTPPASGKEIRGVGAADHAVVIRVLPRQRAADTFEFLGRRTQKALLKALGGTEVAAILAMSPLGRSKGDCGVSSTKAFR